MPEILFLFKNDIIPLFGVVVAFKGSFQAGQTGTGKGRRWAGRGKERELVEKIIDTVDTIY